MKPAEKRKILARLIEIYVKEGNEITDLVGRPLNYFNYDNIKNIIEIHERTEKFYPPHN